MITRGQLLDLGLTKSGISHRLRTKRLRRLHRAVFVVGGREVRRQERMIAAVLACGQGALLSHDSAAELWGIRRARGGPIEVSVPARSRRRPKGIRVHRRGGLIAIDRGVRLGIPATSPARTLVDLAPRLSAAQLEAAINEADRLDLIDPSRLRTVVQEMRGQPGARTVLRLLDRQVFRMTDSELERRFLRLIRSAGLPRPETRRVVNGFRVDFCWPDLGLVVETDGLRYHRTAAQQARDRRRDQAHTAAGLTTLRFTHAQVRFEPDEVIVVMARVIGRLAARRHAA